MNQNLLPLYHQLISLLVLSINFQVLHIIYCKEYYANTDELDSEPEIEIWEDSEEAEAPPEEFTGFATTDTIPNTSHALSRWILR